MALESLKKLMFTDVEETSPKQKAKVEPTVSFKQETTFPKSEPNSGLFGIFGSSPKQTTNSSGVTDEHINNAVRIYTEGFNSLNQNGYDFFEFYQAVIAAGVDNPIVYTMAFGMGNSMDKTLSKDKLIQQSDYYISELNKVYNDFISKGNAKKNELVNQKNSENQNLVSELDLMNQQMEILKGQIEDRQSKLHAIDGKYEPMISDIDNKLGANTIAKNQLVQSIEQVKSGILTNIK